MGTASINWLNMPVQAVLKLLCSTSDWTGWEMLWLDKPVQSLVEQGGSTSA
jgi:hypothetical protein